MRSKQPSGLEKSLALPWAVINACRRCWINQYQASPLLVALYHHQWLREGRHFCPGWIHSWQGRAAGPSLPMGGDSNWSFPRVLSWKSGTEGRRVCMCHGQTHLTPFPHCCSPPTESLPVGR